MDIKVNGAMNVETAQAFSKTKKVENEELIFGTNSAEDKTPGVDPARVIQVQNVGVDIKTDYINPKNPKMYLTVNDIALALAKEGLESLKDVKGLNIKVVQNRPGAVMYIFDDIMIEIENKKKVDVIYTNYKNQMKIQSYSIPFLEETTNTIKHKSMDLLKVH